ncbi:MAG: hypothetical protein IJK89_03465 [Clostridia bacterium]|nr:hypothetical protein [Clostridia bacterium]
MANEKKVRILPVAFGAAVVLAALASTVIVAADGAYRDIGVGLISVALASFIADFLILMALKRRTVIAGIVKFFAILLVNCLLFIPAGVYWFGPVAIFHPNADPAAEELLAAEPNVTADISKDEGLYGWRYNCGQPDAPVILCFYGNGETASRKMADFCEYIGQGYFSGFDIAVYDYPGYGHAPGRSTEATVTAMSLAAYDHLRKTDDSVYVFGYSVGTGPANFVVANREIGALVLMAPYADGCDLFNHFIPVFRFPVLQRLISFKMDNASLAGRVKVAPLVIASHNDETVPFASSERLVSCYADAVFEAVDVPDHAAFWNSVACLQMASDYFTEATV